MDERTLLLQSIASTIESYRMGEIAKPDASHVERWINQFPGQLQVHMLRELHPVLKQCFLTRERVTSYVARLVSSEKIAGSKVAEFWRRANFLSVQHDGNSQREMLKLFDEQLKQQFGIVLKECGSPEGDYIYLDDIVCTGNRATADLESWVNKNAPDKCTLHVISLVMHTGGVYNLTSGKLKKVITASSKQIEVKYWHFYNIENRRYYRNRSEVLWPVALPNDEAMQDYVKRMKFPFEPRAVVNVDSRIFSTEEGRQALETGFLSAGMQIRSHQGSPKDSLKPLGYGNFAVGFGSTFSTYRNCPNTAPLAMWWGNGDDGGALQWYPLLPRKTYSSAENVFNKLFVE